ncbi:uncharacterized protein LOC128550861 [Mercenaria mercenaria]|uniref:uncharacterized protein LOC128550861 n=1 Tax=Mercenaria mercenaria TaxID=6596 RepID=UPI00234EDB62|nr:uncharacterized protein LOC128550861 [Mercenaria mercenaria]
MRQELLEGKIAGANGTVSESGWSNSEVFQQYMETHLMKYLPERNDDLPVLLLFDGHRSHVNLNLIEWARNQHIILYVLPAHTSHVLQPIDVGCFGPYERIFNELSHRYMREHCGQSITKYNICSIGCAAYTSGLSVANLQSAFQKSGVYPFNPDAVDCSNFKVAEVQEQENLEDATSCHQEELNDMPCDDTSAAFFSVKEKPLKTKKRQTKKRRLVSYIVSGQAITEEVIIDKIIEHQQAVNPRKKSAQAPLPGPSGLNHAKRANKTASKKSKIPSPAASLSSDDD